MIIARTLRQTLLAGEQGCRLSSASPVSSAASVKMPPFSVFRKMCLWRLLAVRNLDGSQQNIKERQTMKEEQS